MRDNLREHVDSNREEFELYPVDPKGWEKIAKELGPQKRKPNAWMLGVAACLAIVFISGVLMMTSTGSETPSEFAEVESYYQENIDQKVSLVKERLGEDDQVLQDLESMDQAFAELKSDLDENVDNEEVVTAMMENYRLKLKILEEILAELEKEQE